MTTENVSFIYRDRWRRMASCLLLAGTTLLFGDDQNAEPTSRSDDAILFVSSRTGKNRAAIYVMNADGSEVKRISPDDVILEFDPVFSPDRRRIAFARVPWKREQDYQSAIYIMNADGSDPQRLTFEPEMACAPTWSPDGKRIAFCDFNVWNGNTGIFVIDADGRNRRKLAEGIYPSWSPDGKRILFASKAAMGRTDLATVNAASGEIESVDDEWALTSAWSPDGERIVYTRVAAAGDGPKEVDLYVMNSDGTGRRRLTEKPESEFGPQWSADGKSIFFARLPPFDEDRARASEQSELVVIDADGAHERQLTRNEFFDCLRIGSFWAFYTHPQK